MRSHWRVLNRGVKWSSQFLKGSFWLWWWGPVIEATRPMGDTARLRESSYHLIPQHLGEMDVILLCPSCAWGNSGWQQITCQGTQPVKQSWFKPRVCRDPRVVSGTRLLARLQGEVTQIRGLKAISRKERGKRQNRGKNVFCFTEPSVPNKEMPNYVFHLASCAYRDHPLVSQSERD